MQRLGMILKRHPHRPLAFLIVGLLCWAILFAPQSGAHAATAQETPTNTLAQSQIFTDDLVVEAGQVYENDVNVYSGDVTVEAGGLIRGSLYVYSGNVEIEEGGEVQGDVAAFSGDVTVAGQVGGNLAVLSGDIELDDSAVVNGDLSVMSGEIDQAAGARIQGNVARGPNLRIPVPEIFGAPAAPEAPATPERPFAPRPQQAERGIIGSLVGFILRLIGAAIFTGVVGVLAWLLYTTRPDIVRKVRVAAEEQLALSFAVGAIVNVGLLFLTMVFIFTLCLAPVGFVTGLLLLALNIVGWSAISLWVGERLSAYAKTSAQPVAYLVLGVLATAGLVSLLWALGCWRTCIFLIGLLASSPGVGALIVPWLRRGTSNGGSTVATYPASTASAPTETPVVTPAPTADVTSSPVQAESAATILTPGNETTTAPDPGTVIVTPATVDDFQAPPTPVDFTRINGIGPVFDTKLKDAGVQTFAQLAAMTPEAVAEIIGWSPERVINDDILGQARILAEQA